MESGVYNTKLKPLIILFLFIFILPLASFGQVQEHAPSEHHKNHIIALIIGHTHIPRGVPSASDSGPLIVPSWGINYDFLVSKKWSIGLHTDMEIANYVIEEKNGNQLERTRPFILSIVTAYRPWKGLIVGLGFGNEFEKHHNFLVYRFGLEYAFEINESWEIGPALTYDIKESTYDAWTLGFGVVRKF
jgi:hypothetical protein